MSSIAAFSQDITGIRQADEELIKKNEGLHILNEELTATQEELRQSIDELTTMEHELRETGQYLENLIQYANAPIIVWDPAFRITRFNHAFELLVDRKAADVIGQPLELLFPKFAEPMLDIHQNDHPGRADGGRGDPYSPSERGSHNRPLEFCSHLWA